MVGNTQEIDHWVVFMSLIDESLIWGTKKYQDKKYDGCNDPNDHLLACQSMWVLWPKDEWVHYFVHTLDEILRQWYVSAGLCR